MLSDLLRRSGAQNVNLTDPFTRADTPAGSGLGNVPGIGGQLWEIVSGSWRILANRAQCDTAASSNPIAVLRGGTGNFDQTVSVSSGGGDALYARVQDASNWLRARVRCYQVTTNGGYYEYQWSRSVITGGSAPYTEYYWTRQVITGGSAPYTEYEWARNYTHNEFAATHTGLSNPSPSSTTKREWSTSSTTSPSISSNTFHLHTTTSGGSNQTSHTHSYSANGASYKTGATRSVGGYTYGTEGAWSSSSTYSPWTGTGNVGSYSGSTRGQGGYTYGTEYAWSTSTSTSPWAGSGNQGSYNGASRFINTASTATYYQTIIERCINGVITSRGVSGNLSPPNALRFRGVGTALSVFVNGSGTASLTGTDNGNVSVGKHGIGKGTSDLTGHFLDNYSLNTNVS